MATTAKKIIEKAQSWIGKKEVDGSFKSIIDIYNKHTPLARGYKVKYTDEWCATTISALAISCNATDIIPTECSCQRMIEKFKEIGCWKEDENVTPKKGWIIFYDWGDDGVGDAKGWADHVGIVEKVSDGIISIIEGNYNRSVKRRNLEVNARYIRGYGVPKYIKDTYYPKYKGNSASIVEALNSLGINSTLAHRAKIAFVNGIVHDLDEFKGTATQNTKLLQLLKLGKLKKV